MLKHIEVGDRLYYIHKVTGHLESVPVIDIKEDYFVVYLNGRERKLSYDFIGTRLFATPVLAETFSRAIPKSNCEEKSSTGSIHSLDNVAPLPSPPPPAPSCDNCQLRRNETCTLIRSELCSDYKAVPYVSAAEQSTWATSTTIDSFKKNGKKRYIGFQNPYSKKI